eukprot:5215521-Karenia_brevis.AAC.1
MAQLSSHVHIQPASHVSCCILSSFHFGHFGASLSIWSSRILELFGCNLLLSSFRPLQFSANLDQHRVFTLMVVLTMLQGPPGLSFIAPTGVWTSSHWVTSPLGLHCHDGVIHHGSALTSSIDYSFPQLARCITMPMMLPTCSSMAHEGPDMGPDTS